jgi:CPA1 family monovalent cation:H+ antiporter
VILVTLVFQGLTLPWIIRKVNMGDKWSIFPEKKQEMIIQKKIAQHSLQYLEERFGQGWPQNEHLKNLNERLKIDLKFLIQDLEDIEIKENPVRNFQQIYLELLDRQRKLLNDMNHRAEFDEDLIRKYLSLIDLEEFKLREKQIAEK